MESGWDPEVKKYFVKLLNSISMGLLWMITMVTAGLYFELGHMVTGRPVIYTILFYLVLIGSLILLLRYFYRLWRK